MNSTLKVWTGLGLATALMGAGLAGCAGEAGEGGEGDAAATANGEMGEGEGGEGEGGEGEGGEGEGGVDIGAASSDPVVYGSALAIVEAHAIAARDAYMIGKPEAAAEMFAHPVSEVLADMDPVFKELGVADIKPTLSKASTAAQKAGNEAEVETGFDAVIEAVRAASEKAPSSSLGEGAVAAGIVSDQIDRAASMYGEAAGSDSYETYLDGYGFYKAAASAFERDGDAILKADGSLHKSITDALSLLETAYPGAERPATLEANQGALSGASSKVKLALPTT
ncbi:MAG: hypothetical protein AAF127_13250 [Pseudomonadota bacterium]